MSEFGDDMRGLAVELTEFFSEELGELEIKHVIGQTHDTSTGTTVTTYSTETAYITFTEIEAKDISDQSMIATHMKAVVAGDNITFEPSNGDLVQFKDLTYHKVEEVKLDQFDAAYMMIVEKKNAS